MPNTFVIAKRTLEELHKRVPEFKPQTFLDYGAGLGI